MIEALSVEEDSEDPPVSTGAAAGIAAGGTIAIGGILYMEYLFKRSTFGQKVTKFWNTCY